jgi:hypothetical protein
MAGNIFTRLIDLGQSLSGVYNDPKQARAQLEQKKLVNPVIEQEIRQAVFAAVVPVIRSMLALNYTASGVGIKTGTLYRGTVSDATINFSVDGNFIEIRMPSGLTYGEGKGNVYSNAGAKKYGALYQERPMRAILDTVIGGADRGYGSQNGHAIFGYRKQGLLGAKAKQSVKKAVLKGAKLSNRQGKAADAIKTGNITVVPPKPPFFTLLPAQIQQLRWVQLQTIQAELQKRGMNSVPDDLQVGFRTVGT